MEAAGNVAGELRRWLIGGCPLANKHAGNTPHHDAAECCIIYKSIVSSAGVISNSDKVV